MFQRAKVLKCLICRTKANAFIVKDKRYFFCEKCGLVFKDPYLWVDVGVERERYILHQNSRDDVGYVVYLNGFLERAVLPFVKNNPKVLDYGCGREPVLVGLMRERKWQVSLYDIFFYPDDVFSESYDLIVSTEVFEHLYHPLEVFQTLVSLLKNGGVLSVQTLFYPESLGKDFEHWWYRRDVTHVVFFSERTFEYLANQFSLDVLYSDGKKEIVFLRNS